MTNFKRTTYKNTSNVISKISDVKFNLEHSNVNFVQRLRLHVMAHAIFSLFTGEKRIVSLLR